MAKPKTVEPGRKCSRAVLDGWLKMSAAVLVRAGQDAQAGSLEACTWLLNDPVAELLATVLELDLNIIRRRAAAWERAAVARGPTPAIVIRVGCPAAVQAAGGL